MDLSGRIGDDDMAPVERIGGPGRRRLARGEGHGRSHGTSAPEKSSIAPCARRSFGRIPQVGYSSSSTASGRATSSRQDASAGGPAPSARILSATNASSSLSSGNARSRRCRSKRSERPFSWPCTRRHADRLHRHQVGRLDHQYALDAAIGRQALHVKTSGSHFAHARRDPSAEVTHRHRRRRTTRRRARAPRTAPPAPGQLDRRRAPRGSPRGSSVDRERLLAGSAHAVSLARPRRVAAMLGCQAVAVALPARSFTDPLDPQRIVREPPRLELSKRAAKLHPTVPPRPRAEAYPGNGSGCGRGRLVRTGPWTP